MLFLERPKDFSPRFEVVSCFLESEGKILLLHRQDHKQQGGTWGAPAGKREKGESIRQAIIREVSEETGILLEEKNLVHFKEVYVRYKDFDFTYHLFHQALDSGAAGAVRIDPEEHKAFAWKSPNEALQMNLIEDEDGCIRLFYFKDKKI